MIHAVLRASSSIECGNTGLYCEQTSNAGRHTQAALGESNESDVRGLRRAREQAFMYETATPQIPFGRTQVKLVV